MDTVFRQLYIQDRICVDVAPGDGLIERTPQQGMYPLDHLWGNCLAGVFLPLGHNRRLVLQLVIILIQVAEKHIADIGLDIILNAVAATGEVGIPLVVQAVELHVFIHQLTNGDKLL